MGEIAKNKHRITAIETISDMQMESGHPQNKNGTNL